MNDERRSPDNAIEIQYNKLSEDWRQLNSMLWGIPSVAISIMAGIVVVSYQLELGWPRFVTLVVGSIFLFALTLEVLKKALFMTVIIDRLNNLQRYGLKLKGMEEGLGKESTAFSPHPENVVKVLDDKNRVLKRIHILTKYGREVLAWVIFLSAIGVLSLAFLTLYAIVNPSS
jgi:hypothetical protein